MVHMTGKLRCEKFVYVWEPRAEGKALSCRRCWLRRNMQKSAIWCMVWDDWRRSKWKLVFPSDARHSSVPIEGMIEGCLDTSQIRLNISQKTVPSNQIPWRSSRSLLGAKLLPRVIVWGKAREECHFTYLLHIRCCSFCSLKECKRWSMEMATKDGWKSKKPTELTLDNWWAYCA